MEGYTKLFSGIVASTVWAYDSDTKVVWITMMAMADQHGQVIATVPGLSRLAGVHIDATRRAIDLFLGPDPDSGSKEFEGRRIEVIDRGWRLLNHAKYRALRSKDEKAAYDREYHAEKRSLEKVDVVKVVKGRKASDRVVKVVQAEAPSEAETSSDGREASSDHAKPIAERTAARPPTKSPAPDPETVRAAARELFKRWPHNDRSKERVQDVIDLMVRICRTEDDVAIYKAAAWQYQNDLPNWTEEMYEKRYSMKSFLTDQYDRFLPRELDMDNPTAWKPPTEEQTAAKLADYETPATLVIPEL